MTTARREPYTFAFLMRRDASVKGPPVAVKDDFRRIGLQSQFHANLHECAQRL